MCAYAKHIFLAKKKKKDGTLNKLEMALKVNVCRSLNDQFWGPFWLRIFGDAPDIWDVLRVWLQFLQGGQSYTA